MSLRSGEGVWLRADQRRNLREPPTAGLLGAARQFLTDPHVQGPESGGVGGVYAGRRGSGVGLTASCSAGTAEAHTLLGRHPERALGKRRPGLSGKAGVGWGPSAQAGKKRKALPFTALA